MKLLFDKKLGAADDARVRFYPEMGKRDEGIDVKKIFADAELTAAGLEAVEVCPTEAIIRSWKQLRRDEGRL